MLPHKARRKKRRRRRSQRSRRPSVVASLHHQVRARRPRLLRGRRRPQRSVQLRRRKKKRRRRRRSPQLRSALREAGTEGCVLSTTDGAIGSTSGATKFCSAHCASACTLQEMNIVICLRTRDLTCGEVRTRRRTTSFFSVIPCIAVTATLMWQTASALDR